MRTAGLVAQMRELITTSAFQLSQFPRMEALYRSLEARPRNGTAGARPLTFLHADNGGLAELDESVEALATAFRAAQWPLNRNVDESLEACRQRAPMPGVPMPAEALEWDVACDLLASTATQYCAQLSRFEMGLAVLRAAARQVPVVTDVNTTEAQ